MSTVTPEYLSENLWLIGDICKQADRLIETGGSAAFSAADVCGDGWSVFRTPYELEAVLARDSELSLTEAESYAHSRNTQLALSARNTALRLAVRATLDHESHQPDPASDPELLRYTSAHYDAVAPMANCSLARVALKGFEVFDHATHYGIATAEGDAENILSITLLGERPIDIQNQTMTPRVAMGPEKWIDMLANACSDSLGLQLFGNVGEFSVDVARSTSKHTTPTTQELTGSLLRILTL